MYTIQDHAHANIIAQTSGLDAIEFIGIILLLSIDLSYICSSL